MKKIVFVQKDQGSYDPVSAFFAKKNPSVPKTSNASTKLTSAAKDPPLKKVETPKLTQPNSHFGLQSKKDETSQLLQNNKTQPPPISKGYHPKQQGLRTKDLSKKNIKKQSKATQEVNHSSKSIFQQPRSQPHSQIQEDSLEKLAAEQTSKIARKTQHHSNFNKSDDADKSIRELKLREEEYIRRIETFEAKEQKFIKNQQRIIKLQKDLKTAVQKVKEGEGAMERLRQKEIQFKEMMDGKQIPFNRKREVILSNKLKQLKRINKQLVLRLKNYKGTDLVQVSIQQNRQEIMKDLYTVDVSKQMNEELNIQMQSLTSQLSQKLDQYILNRVKEKGQRIGWSEQQSFLLDLVHLSQQISLAYLDKYQICPLPQSNEEAISSYSILQNYKTSNRMKKVTDKYELNLSFSKDNIELLQYLEQGHSQMITLKSQVERPQKKRQIVDKARFNDFLCISERRSNFNQILLVQTICQLQLMKEWIQKTHQKVISELNSISNVLAEIKNIVSVGQTAKESLYFYLSNNISLLEAKLPSLKLTLKQIKANLPQVEGLFSGKKK